MRPLPFLSQEVHVEVREEVRELARTLAEEEGLELVDVELQSLGRRLVVRVLLDRPGGVALSDCARLSRRLADCMDMNQIVPGPYQLEVSSPGVDRPLRSLESVSRFTGERATLVLREPREGRRKFEGRLLSPIDGRVGLREEDGNEQWFGWVEVQKAHLNVDPWAGRRGGQEPR